MLAFLGFGWSGLDQDALVVDVGGGIGGQSLILAQNCPNLRFVVQDRENVIKDATAVCIQSHEQSSIFCTNSPSVLG